MLDDDDDGDDHDNDNNYVGQKLFVLQLLFGHKDADRSSCSTWTTI